MSLQGGGSPVQVLAPLRVGRSAQPADLGVFTSAGASEANLRIGDFGAAGASLELFEEDGATRHTWLAPDAQGSGGFLRIEGPGSGSFWVDGAAADGSPAVGIEGAGSTVLFRSGEHLSEAVQLPPGAVESVEIIDEPGVASNLGTDQIILTGNHDLLVSRTIAAPKDGYIVGWATAAFRVFHLGQHDSGLSYGLSTDCDADPAFTDQLYLVGFNESQAPGLYDRPQSVQATFPVAAGIHTVCLLADQVGDTTVHVSARQLTLAFFPTAYGAVVAPSSTPAAAAADPDDGGGTSRPPLTQDEVAAERSAGVALELARLEREQDQNQARLEALRVELGTGSQGE